MFNICGGCKGYTLFALSNCISVNHFSIPFHTLGIDTIIGYYVKRMKEIAVNVVLHWCVAGGTSRRGFCFKWNMKFPYMIVMLLQLLRFSHFINCSNVMWVFLTAGTTMFASDLHWTIGERGFLGWTIRREEFWNDKASDFSEFVNIQNFSQSGTTNKVGANGKPSYKSNQKRWQENIVILIASGSHKDTHRSWLLGQWPKTIKLQTKLLGFFKSFVVWKTILNDKISA